MLYNSGQWTEARFNSFIKGALRAASRRWPPKYETLNDACVGTKINIKTGRLAKHYRCAQCLGEFPAKDVQVDHVFPIVDPSVGFTTWDDIVYGMFCEKINLQVLCVECHKVKTGKEKAISNELKRKQKSLHQTVG